MKTPPGRMNAYQGLNTTNSVFSPVTTDNYGERISYDPNGNILTYKRNGTTTPYGSTPVAHPRPMDALTYNYGTANNQLGYVDDAITATNYTEDIDDQNPNNYVYDKIGNLVKDDAEGITSISWTVYGKIQTINKTKAGTTTTINYTYDASGNRISKKVNDKTTIYIRDASGNVMSLYEASTSTSVAVQTEIHLYGSSRLGIATTPAIPANVTVAAGFGTGKLTTFTRGDKLFELSNHLGNVLVTVTDKKLPVANTANTAVDYYLPDVATATDYYPFGMAMPGRTFTSQSAYRYGFNGKENDKDISEGGQDYGMRISDNRLGRFLSVDPITSEYPALTPYQFASNSPISGIDLDGLEYKYSAAKIEREKYENYSDNKFLNLIANKDAFGANVGISIWNGAVGAAEDLTNLAFSSKGRDEVVLKYGKSMMALIEFSNQPHSGAELINMAKAFVADPKNLEDLAAGFVGGWILGKFLGLVSKIKIPKPLPLPEGTQTNGFFARGSSADHHIATNKNSISTARGGPWTPRFEPFFKNAGLDINKSPENIVNVIDHFGPHPEAYHNLVFERLTKATAGIKANTAAYKTAVTNTLQTIGKEAQTVGSTVNKLITQ